jgi:GNAT superfamily N-acetyltransferase
MTDPNRVETVAPAKKDGKTVGFALLRIVPCVLYSTPHAELAELFVLEEYRQYGIGKRLLRFMERLALQHGAKSMLSKQQPRAESLSFCWVFRVRHLFGKFTK